ncbi:MAG TPA: TetR/AcrR family transcriptional regulator [Gemmatimonadaceae bacterium]|nr:TetR/AcrR family transcriptional regulator [Gemmatimonadaceae bacterium]
MPGRKAPEETRREQIVSAAYEVALRTGIDGVTLRTVAAKAKLSHGLIVFYFKQKDQLIGALLDRVLATTAMLHVSQDVARIPHAPERLGALLRQELDRLSRDPRGMRLFFEYWALGVRQGVTRRRIGAALERYRAAFRTLAEEMLPTAPPNGTDVTPDALAAVAVSLVSGYAVQAMIDPGHFDTGAYLAAAQSLIERLAPAPA